jgi:quercetin dioxygenase-like cupin family protein
MEELVQARASVLATQLAADLPKTVREGAALRRLCPAGSGLAFERIELAARSELARGAQPKLDPCYLACERGEVEVRTGDERTLLKSGDVAIVSRGAAHSCVNRGRGAAVVYSVRSVAVG